MEQSGKHKNINKRLLAILLCAILLAPTIGGMFVVIRSAFASSPQSSPYQITYHNVITSHSNPTSWVYGSGFTLTDPTARAGHTFAGWFDAEVLGNNVTQITATDEGNKDLWARWTPNTYYITYNGIIPSNPNPASWVYGNAFAFLNPGTREGFTFVGWFNAENDGNKIDGITSEDINNKTLWARWEEEQVGPKTYYIAYNGIIPSNPNPTSWVYGTGFALQDPGAFIGHTFAGWFDAPSGGNKITEIAASDEEDKVLWARWTPIGQTTYQITYNGIIPSNPNPTSWVYGSEFALLNPGPRAGYMFDGWYDAETGGEKVTNITTTDVGDKILWAQWTVAQYNTPNWTFANLRRDDLKLILDGLTDPNGDLTIKWFRKAGKRDFVELDISGQKTLDIVRDTNYKVTYKCEIYFGEELVKTLESTVKPRVHWVFYVFLGFCGLLTVSVLLIVFFMRDAKPRGGGGSPRRSSSSAGPRGGPSAGPKRRSPLIR